MQNLNKNGLGELNFANINSELLKKVKILEDELNEKNNTDNIILMALNNTIKSNDNH